ncbi:MAG: hypothetical protein ACOYOB_02730 [Myxococcota bacterium]
MPAFPEGPIPGDPLDLPSAGRRRLVGAIALVALTALVATAHVLRARRQGDDALTTAFRDLAAAVDGPAADRQAHVASARKSFGEAATAIAPEGVALYGVELTERLVPGPVPPRWATPAPKESAALVDAVRERLEHGRPDAALDLLDQAGPLGRHRDVGVLRAFAQSWQAARKSRP